MEFKDDLNKEEVHAEWSRLRSTIEKRQAEAVKVVQIPSLNWKKYLSIAASVMLIAFVSVWLINRPSYTIYATGYGEQRHIELPDGSRAVLNSNSSIKFRSDWQKELPREVEINGEAFFSVIHTPDDKPFFVRTGDGMQVEVLGTEFNVYERRGMQRVVLNSGSVRLQYAAMENNKPILMKPGEMVIRENALARPEKRKVNASHYSTWINGHLVFENTPLREVCRILEDDFGINASLADTALNRRLFNGTFRADDAEILLKALMTTYDLKAVRSGSVLKLIRK